MAYATRKKKSAASLYQVVSGKTHRVAARTKKLVTARKRAEGLVRRGSKRVSIMRGGKLIATMGTFRSPAKRRSSKRKTSAGRRTSRKAARRSSRRRSSVRRRSSKRRVSKNRRRSSRRRVSRRRTSRR